MTDERPVVDLDFRDLDGTQLEIFTGGFREMLGAERAHYVTIGVMHYKAGEGGLVWIVGAGSETTDLGDVLPLAICRNEKVAYEVISRVSSALKTAGIAQTIAVEPSRSHVDLENPGLFLSREEILRAVMMRLGPPEDGAPDVFTNATEALRSGTVTEAGTAMIAFVEAVVTATLDVVSMVQDSL
jgi:hypothetical protein